MSDDALLVLVNVAGADWMYPVTPKRQLIGRSNAAPIQIPAAFKGVSRSHAEVWCESDKIWLCDVGSRGGTRVNGVWLRTGQPANIIPGDRLTLGDAELRLEPFSRQTSSPDGEFELEPPGNPNADTIIYRSPSRPLSQCSLEQLSFSEHNVLLWMARGYTQDGELAGLLHRSPHTIRTQVANIIKKCGLHSRGCVLSELQRDGAALRIVRAARDDALP